MEGVSHSELDKTDQNVITDLKDYEAIFSDGCEFPARGEATVFYLYSKKAAENIKKLIPDVHLFILARDPAQRAFSHFLYSQQIGRADKHWKFEDALFAQDGLWDFRYLEMGFYQKYISIYDALFPKEQVHILFFEDLVKDPVELAQIFFRKLGVDPSFVPSHRLEYAKSGLPKRNWWHKFLTRRNIFKDLTKWILPHSVRYQLKTKWINKNLHKPKMDTAIHQKLIEIYFDDIKWLESRTGRNLSHWLTVK